MKIELSRNEVDSWLIGLQMAYGEDENGPFHMLDVGLLFFSITIYKY